MAAVVTDKLRPWTTDNAPWGLTQEAVLEHIKAPWGAPHIPEPVDPQIDMSENNGGVKHDTGKLRWHLLPPELEEVVRAFEYGAGEYGEGNWELGLSYTRCFSAIMRHLWAWFTGKEARDQVSRLHHLASVSFYCLALMRLETTRPEFDDRRLV